MLSGEVTSVHSTMRGRAEPASLVFAHSGYGSRRSRTNRLFASLFLFCCLITALCGFASAAGETYAPLWEFGAGDAVSSVAITQDGSTIVAGAGRVVYLVDREGAVIWRTPVGSRVNGVGISPEGSQIGVAADKLYLFDRSGDLVWTEKTTFVYNDVALSSNGAYIAAGCDNGAIYLFDKNKKTLWDYDMGTDTHGIAISDNGRVIAVGCDNQGVYYLNSRQGESWSYGTGKRVEGIALTPDGRFVAAGSLDRCVYLSTGQGEHLWKYPTSDAILSTALTNEAREVFAASGRTVYVLDRTGAEIQKITLNGRAESVAVTPDGTFLVVGGGDGDRFIRLFTRDTALLESGEPEEAVGGGVELPTPVEDDLTPLPTAANESSGSVVEADARVPDGEVPIVSQVLGWVENIISLFLEPQEDFLA